jgi:hypothetical protein
MNSDHVLTLASINIERSKHLSRVFSFLEAVNPDVVCLKEVIEEDICAFRIASTTSITSMHRCPGIQKMGETAHRDLVNRSPLPTRIFLGRRTVLPHYRA